MSPLKACLIICTYQRPQAVLKLLASVNEQTTYPHQILIIDGSLDTATQDALASGSWKNLQYHLVSKTDRGLTRQRNFGIQLVDPSCDIVCFLDDDVILEPNYFEAILDTFSEKPEAVGVGGFITNEVEWTPLESGEGKSANYFVYDGYYRSEGARYKLRAKLGLIEADAPGMMPSGSHGRPVGYLPPSGKIYPAELLMGCSMSFRKSVFGHSSFSTYFEGYGLYEDADFCLDVAKHGHQYVNTNARLAHYHEASGRPNHFKYGKMVVRNGWYVWRCKYPKPSLKQRFRWNATSFVLTMVRLSNAIKGNDRKAAFQESMGRFAGWGSLIFNKPKRA